MSGSKTEKTRTFFHPKRTYLFGLLTIVLFLGLNFLIPGSKPLKQTSVSIEFSHDGTERLRDATQQALLNELKEQLSHETLSQTLKSVGEKTAISSDLFPRTDSQFDVESIRTKLIEGALSVEKLTPIHASTKHSDAIVSGSMEHHQSGKSEQPQVAGFRLSILGSGTDDELWFVKLLAEKIKDSVSPDYDRDQIKSEIHSIRDGMVTTSKMNKALRESVSKTFEKYTRRQEQLLASASNPSNLASAITSGAESVELKQMRRSREQCIQEFRINEGKDFVGKADIQDGLNARIRFLNQEIQKQSEKEQSQNQRMANKQPGVERATFIDTGVSGIQPFELEQEVSSLKTEVALLVGKIDIAAKQHSDNLAISSKLTRILDSNAESTVYVSDPSQESVWKTPKSLIWIALASVVISGVTVVRIRSGAFANHFTNQSSIEESLQLPVIDQVTLPTLAKKEETNIIVQQTRWVRMLTKTCEVVLLVGLVGIVCLLLLQSNSAKQILFQPTSFFQ